MTTKTRNDIPQADGRTDADRAALTQVLNRQLALAADLYSQIKQAHWTVVGPNFIALHKLFDEQAAVVLGHIDLYAERIRALRGVPAGTIRQAVRESPLPDLEARELPGPEAVSEILQRFESYSASLTAAMEACEQHEDLATQDIFIEAAREVDKNAYFLRSHLRD